MIFSSSQQKHRHPCGTEVKLSIIVIFTFNEFFRDAVSSCAAGSAKQSGLIRSFPACCICLQTATNTYEALKLFPASINRFVFTQTSDKINMCSLPPSLRGARGIESKRIDHPPGCSYRLTRGPHLYTRKVLHS